MPTKVKSKLLKDGVANIILTDEDTREYVETLISKATDIPLEVIKGNLTLLTPRVNKNVNTKYSYVDAIYDSEASLINIEVNYSNQADTNSKNIRYMCQLLLRQTKKGKKDYTLKPIYQININGYDIFKQGKFIYKSVLMEETIHKKRNDFFNIIDINVEFLRNIDYNMIEKEDGISLEKLLYIFICDDNKELDELYLGDKVMEKVREKISTLTDDFDKELYYDREEYINELSYAEGVADRNIEIAKEMLKDKISLAMITKYTGLTEEEINSLK